VRLFGQFDCFGPVSDGGLRAGGQYPGQVLAGDRILRLEFQRPLVVRNRTARLAFQEERVAEVVLKFRVNGLEGRGFLVMDNGLVHLPLLK